MGVIAPRSARRNQQKSPENKHKEQQIAVQMRPNDQFHAGEVKGEEGSNRVGQEPKAKGPCRGGAASCKALQQEKQQNDNRAMKRQSQRLARHEVVVFLVA